MGRKRIAALQVSPQQREREREALSRHWGTPPPCWDRRSFCSIGAQTDPWRTFHGPFLGANSPPPRTPSDIPSTAGPHTHSGGFSHSGAMLFCCTAAIGDSNSKAAQPFHFGTAWHSLSLSLSFSPWHCPLGLQQSTQIHVPAQRAHPYTHTHLAEIRHKTAQKKTFTACLPSLPLTLVYSLSLSLSHSLSLCHTLSLSPSLSLSVSRP